MFKIIVAIVIIKFFTTTGVASEKPKPLSLKNVENIELNFNQDKQVYQIEVATKYTNKCFSEVEKFKSVSLANENLGFQLYSATDENQLCKKIYLPYYKKIILDTIRPATLKKIKTISVNDVVINVN